MTALLHAICDPYGAESNGGPRHLLGGRYGAAYSGRHHWHCENPAIGRFTAICERGHKGAEMPLCLAHRQEIQRRQMGMCTRCAYPPEALQLDAELEAVTGEFGRMRPEQRMTPRGVELGHRIEQGRLRMDELWANGTIVRLPLRLVEVS